MADEKPLCKISDAFNDLAVAVSSDVADGEVEPFSRACSLVSLLFGCLGIAFKFTEMDYVSKIPTPVGRSFIVSDSTGPAAAGAVVGASETLGKRSREDSVATMEPKDSVLTTSRSTLFINAHLTPLRGTIEMF